MQKAITTAERSSRNEKEMAATYYGGIGINLFVLVCTSVCTNSLSLEANTRKLDADTKARRHSDSKSAPQKPTAPSSSTRTPHTRSTMPAVCTHSGPRRIV